jgi:hypothetical protein
MTLSLSLFLSLSFILLSSARATQQKIGTKNNIIAVSPPAAAEHRRGKRIDDL